MVGPYSGIAIDTVADPSRLVVQRKRLSGRRQELRRRREELESRRGPVWSVAAQKTWYPPRNLEALEIRADAALVDQDLYAFKYETDRGGPLDDGYRIATVHRPDHRFWSTIIRGERSLMRRLVRPQQRFVDAVLRPQRAVLDSWTEFLRELKAGHPALAVVLGIVMAVPYGVFWLLFKIQDALLRGLVRSQKMLLDKTVDLPIIMKEGAIETREEFATQTGRRGLLRALIDEEYLTPERRRVLLFMTGVMLAASWFLAEIMIRLTYPEAVPPKQMTDLVFFYAIGTRVALPLPFEPIVIAAQGVLGFWPTVLISAVGAVVGSWILFIIGGEANKGLKRLFDEIPALNRALQWAEKRARKFGYVVLGAILAIPFSPDTVPLVIFSLLNLKMRWFLLTVFISTIVRISAFLFFFQ